MDEGSSSCVENEGQRDNTLQQKKQTLCDRCGLFLKNFEQHAKIHRQIKKHKCELCDKSFIQRQSLDRHHVVHTGEKEFSCDMCEKKFGQRVSLHRHKKNVHKLKAVVCDTCGKTFQTDQSLQNHKRIAHFPKYSSKQYACEICDRIFLRSDGLLGHKRKEHNIGKPLHTCDVCDKKFLNACQLQKHIITHEDGFFNRPRITKDHICSQCKREFPYGKQLAKHKVKCPMNMFHCDICKKGFSKGSLLNRHMSIHLNAGDIEDSTESVGESGRFTQSVSTDVEDRKLNDTEDASQINSFQFNNRKEFSTASLLDRHKPVYQVKSVIQSDSMKHAGGKQQTQRIATKVQDGNWNGGVDAHPKGFNQLGVLNNHMTNDQFNSQVIIAEPQRVTGNLQQSAVNNTRGILGMLLSNGVQNSIRGERSQNPCSSIGYSRNKCPVAHVKLEYVQRERSMHEPRHGMKMRERGFVNYADVLDDFDL